jgi:plastocyanin
LNLKAWWLILLVSTGSQAAELTVNVTDSQGAPVVGAVVFLESAAASAAVQPVTDARLVQKDKTFVPDVLVIPRGTSVYFPNEDTVRHHVYSFSAIKPFEIKLYVGTPAAPVLFDQSGVAVLGCNIHDEMIAWVVALDTPYYSRSDQQGEAKLTSVPAGEYTLRVWHKDLLNEQDVPKLTVNLNNTPQRTSVQLPQLAPVF